MESYERRDTIYIKTYHYSKEIGNKIKKELNENIPDSVLMKAEGALDGGGFIISYIKKDNDTTKLEIYNPWVKPVKYKKEFKKVNVFFDFANSVIKDSTGQRYIDITREPYVKYR